MSIRTFSLCSALMLFSFSAYAQPTDLDQYLVKQNILNQHYKITDKKRLNEVLEALSEEDSRVMPYQVDQNTVLEQVNSYADHIEVRGLIVTPNFKQFVQDIGQAEVNQLFKQGILHNCQHFFEHEFQRVNPYTLQMKLNSDYGTYELTLKNTECKF